MLFFIGSLNAIWQCCRGEPERGAAVVRPRSLPAPTAPQIPPQEQESTDSTMSDEEPIEADLSKYDVVSEEELSAEEQALNALRNFNDRVYGHISSDAKRVLERFPELAHEISEVLIDQYPTILNYFDTAGILKFVFENSPELADQAAAVFMQKLRTLQDEFDHNWLDENLPVFVTHFGQSFGRYQVDLQALFLSLIRNGRTPFITQTYAESLLRYTGDSFENVVGNLLLDMIEQAPPEDHFDNNLYSAVYYNIPSMRAELLEIIMEKLALNIRDDYRRGILDRISWTILDARRDGSLHFYPANILRGVLHLQDELLQWARDARHIDFPAIQDAVNRNARVELSTYIKSRGFRSLLSTHSPLSCDLYYHIARFMVPMPDFVEFPVLPALFSKIFMDAQEGAQAYERRVAFNQWRRAGLLPYTENIEDFDKEIPEVIEDTNYLAQKRREYEEDPANPKENDISFGQWMCIKGYPWPHPEY